MNSTQTNPMNSTQTLDIYKDKMTRNPKIRNSHVSNKLPQQCDFKTLKHYNNHILKRYSPFEFIRMKYFTPIPSSNTKKKKRINDFEFRFLEIGEYSSLMYYNYNVNQLKRLLKHHHLRTTGNKPELMTRLYNILYLGSFARTIQSVVRGYFVRNFFSVRGPAVRNRKCCVNDSDFYSLDPLSEIPMERFLSIQETSHTTTHIYGFDIASLSDYIKTTKHIMNPYTRVKFKQDITKCLDDCIRTAKMLGFTMNININNVKFSTNYLETNLDSIQNNPTTHSTLNPRNTSIHQIREMMSVIDDMGHLGNYTNPVWFEELNMGELAHFLLKTYDIWDYRLGLSEDIKREMIGYNSSCLYPYQFSNISNANHRTQLLDIVCTLMKNLISKSDKEDLRKNGALIIMMGLTLVNENTRNAFPTLYYSVI